MEGGNLKAKKALNVKQMFKYEYFVEHKIRGTQEWVALGQSVSRLVLLGQLAHCPVNQGKGFA